MNTKKMTLAATPLNNAFIAAAVLVVSAALLFYPPSLSFSAENEEQKDRESTSPQYGSVEERRLMESIKKERSRLDKEWERVELRKKELKTIEEGVDKKIAEIDSKLQELHLRQKKIEELLSKKSAAEKKRIASMAKIYEKMDPVKAAAAMSGLDEQLAASIIEQMKVKKAARILDAASKEKTTQLSETYTTIPIE